MKVKSRKVKWKKKKLSEVTGQKRMHEALPQGKEILTAYIPQCCGPLCWAWYRRH